jgi:hypothetical protein
MARLATLIHTSYFEVARIRKLIAFAIAEAEGFRASAVFTSDADYPKVKTWYQGLDRMTAPVSQNANVVAS